MINWDGYNFTEKQINDWMANVRELVELVKAGGGGGGGSVTAAQLLALIQNSSTVTAAFDTSNTKVQFTAIGTGTTLPAYPTTSTMSGNFVLNYELGTGTLSWKEIA